MYQPVVPAGAAFDDYKIPGPEIADTGRVEGHHDRLRVSGSFSYWLVPDRPSMLGSAMPRRPTNRPAFIDHLNKWLIAAQAVAVIVGVGIAVWQLIEISSQTQLQSQSLRTTQATQSATLILQLRNILTSGEYKQITSAIQEHDQKYRLLASAGGAFRDTEIEQYIGNFEDIGLLVKESPLLSDMAYNHFSYDIEKAWCNRDVQKVVAAARKVDKSVTTRTDAIYGEFEKLAGAYLAKERQTCDDLDK